MGTHVRVSGSFEEIISGTSVKVSGAWETVAAIYVRVSGAWEQAFVQLVASLAGTNAAHSTSATFPESATAGVYLNTDGVEYAYSVAGTPTGTSLGDWLDAGAVDAAWVRCTVDSGTLAGGSSDVDTWLVLSSPRGWFVTDTLGSGGPALASITLEIASDAAGANVVETASYDLDALTS